MTTSNTVHNHSHHFDSREQENAAGKEGIWIFLVTELLMFGTLFVVYALMRAKFPEVWEAGGKLLDTRMGAFNTVILIASSLTIAVGLSHVQRGNVAKLKNMTWLTIFFALVFLVVKYFEYTHKFHVGIFPGQNYAYEAAEAMPPNMGLFFGIYFVMTGLHGIHILIGIGLMFWLIHRANRGDFTAESHTYVEGVSLYWHIVDIIWIYLFPLMYLI